MLNIQKDFESIENGGVYLSKRGKQKFLKEFENKIYQKINVNGTTKNYDMLMKEEVKKLERFFTDGEKYKPYKYIN